MFKIFLKLEKENKDNYSLFAMKFKYILKAHLYFLLI